MFRKLLANLALRLGAVPTALLVFLCLLAGHTARGQTIDDSGRSSVKRVPSDLGACVSGACPPGSSCSDGRCVTQTKADRAPERASLGGCVAGACPPGSSCVDGQCLKEGPRKPNLGRTGSKHCKEWKTVDDPGTACREKAVAARCAPTTSFIAPRCIPSEKNCLNDRINYQMCEIRCGATAADEPQSYRVFLYAKAKPEQDSDVSVSVWRPETKTTWSGAAPRSEWQFNGKEENSWLTSHVESWPVCRESWTEIGAFPSRLYPPISTAGLPSPMFLTSYYVGTVKRKYEATDEDIERLGRLRRDTYSSDD